ncbi:alanine racemase [Paenibacillus aurantius]|uniref:Alanine racemase n=1 Tax=Paenibacillus aurantius TaxID=2918900 RepID=A0AA96LE34_9BACL|nr:alanine racemase [Paenibacillus aurantius]WNQ12354.1 alanine racemase [Paenibacillus aurantius]
MERVEAACMIQTNELDTPFVLIDLDLVMGNIASMQAVADQNGIKLRPHAKTHKMPEIARLQMEAGASGVTVAKLGEAEAMIEGGIRNLLIAYPIIGPRKIERLAELLPKAHLTVVVESYDGMKAVSEAGRMAGLTVSVLIEVDSGFNRVGITQEEDVLAIARAIAADPWLKLEGLLTFAGQSYDAGDTEELLRTVKLEAETVRELTERLRKEGFEITVVSAGSTPSSPHVAGMPGITEIRPGTYVFGDLMQVKLGAHKLEHCALTVKVTVISRPAEDRAVIDAGTKVFSSDGEDSPIGTGRGYVPGRPGITLEWMTEEHGMLRLAPEEQGLKIGEQLEVIPVHCCAVVNLTDQVAAVRQGHVVELWKVSARGKVR